MELKKEKGHYSGNRRLDTSNCEEPIHDNEHERERWLGENSKIRIKRKLRRWKNNISPSIDPEKLNVHMVGQSHIDCAWMWRYDQTRKKAQVTYKKAILHSELFPDSYCFALSQPILLEWIKYDNPELFNQIQQKVERGNIELVGGSYVEPDCMMPSGEAMIRQRLYGMRFYFEHFKKLPKVEWFLDSFGYNYGLPQILIKSGAEYLWTSKMTWNRETTFPFVNFWWKGPDGSKILAANFHYDPQVLETWEQYETGRHLLKPDSKKEWDYNNNYERLKTHMSKEEICPEVGLFFGQSDGGHGPTHKEVAYANEQSKLKWFFWSRAELFFKSLEKYSNSFPVWNDELYLEFHRGCFSNHAHVKRYNRKFENILTSLESLNSLLALFFPNYQYPRSQLEKLWKNTLKNQFHDVLPGSSIPEVYDDVWNDWEEQETIIKNQIQNVGKFLTDRNSEGELNSIILLLYNPLSWKRTSPIFIPITNLKTLNKNFDDTTLPYAKITVFDDSKREYICQPVEKESLNFIDPRPKGWWTIIPLKPLAFTIVKFELMEKFENNPERNVKITDESISNDEIFLKVDKSTGAIIELTVKGLNEDQNLLKGENSNLTFGFLDDSPPEYHAWNLTPKYWEHPIDLSNNDIEIVKKDVGPICSSLEITRTLGKSPVTQRITIFKDYPLVYFTYFTNWKQKNVMLKINYTPNLKADEVIADGAYCSTRSKIYPETPCDKARFEKICHKYFDISNIENNWGLALINEGKYAYDVMEGNMRLTLLRACRYPDPAPEAWVNTERELNKEHFNHEVPEYSGLGHFFCRYALFPHRGATLHYKNGSPNINVVQKAYEFNSPVLEIPKISKMKINDLKKLNSVLNIEPNNIILTSLKFNDWDRDETIILRFYECCGISSKVKVSFKKTFFKKIKHIYPTDLLEREINKPMEINRKLGILEFYLSKHEIRTFKFEIRR